MTLVLFPLGHYFGAFHPGNGQPAEHHVVRVGSETPKLADPHVQLWSLIHGPGPLTDEEIPWTRDTVEAIAGGLGVPGGSGIVDDLLELGAAVEVDTGTDSLEEFARGHRLRGLLHGLGNTAEDRHRYGIGVPGVGPLLRVDLREYELWQWGPLAPTLWDAYAMLTDVWRRTGDVRDTLGARLRDDVEALRLHRLLAHGAAYLDAADPR
jgi:hypothetical protein